MSLEMNIELRITLQTLYEARAVAPFNRVCENYWHTRAISPALFTSDLAKVQDQRLFCKVRQWGAFANRLLSRHHEY